MLRQQGVQPAPEQVRVTPLPVAEIERCLQ
jgi:hypothetical protein